MINKIKDSKILIILIGIVILLVLFMFIKIRTVSLITGLAPSGNGYVTPTPIPTPVPTPTPPSGCFIVKEIEVWDPEECTEEDVIRTKTTFIVWNAPGCEPKIKIETEKCLEIETEKEIGEIEYKTTLEYPYSFSSSMLTSKNIDVKFTNNGKNPIKNINIKIEPPIESESFPSFIRKLGKNWKNSDMTGFAAASPIHSRLLQWNTSPSQYYGELEQDETIQTNFIIDIPMTDAKEKDIYLVVSADGDIIHNKTLKNYIDIPQFLLIPDISEEGILDIYMFIFNIANEDKRFDVEFNVDEYSSLPKTVLAEYFGPYLIKANDIKITAYKYRYDEYFEESDYLLRAILYEKDRKLEEYNYKLNIEDYLTEPLLEKPTILIENKLNSLLMLVLVVILSVMFILTYKFQTKKEIYIRALNAFLSEAVKKGYTKNEIKKMLFEKGWPENVVIRYCDKAFKHIEEKIESFKK
ncbi:hypothetical protein KY342_00765 [Candidatus Woesearchaeota archaeon]|nr:hypothetical protein [Candidatus Woesearchaeota archaeon]